MIESLSIKIYASIVIKIFTIKNFVIEIYLKTKKGVLEGKKLDLLEKKKGLQITILSSQSKKTKKIP